MKRVLIGGGTGLVGKRLTEMLTEKGYEVAYLSRKETEGDIKTICWDVVNMKLDQKEIEPFDHIIRSFFDAQDDFAVV